MDVKVRGDLGSGKRDVHEIEILGQEPDMDRGRSGVRRQRQNTVKRCLEGLGLNEAVNRAAVKTRGDWSRRRHGDVGRLRNKKDSEVLAATLNYMSSDRSDVQYAAKAVCTKMANPSRGSWKKFKKASSYLKGVEKSNMEDGCMAKTTRR